MLFLCYLGGHAYSCSYISKKYVTFLLVRQKDCFIHFTSATILVSTPGNYLGRNNALKLFRQPFRLICIFHFLFSLFEASFFFKIHMVKILIELNKRIFFSKNNIFFWFYLHFTKRSHFIRNKVVYRKSLTASHKVNRAWKSYSDVSFCFVTHTHRKKKQKHIIISAK